MLSQIDQKKIKLKLSNIYNFSNSKSKINDFSKEIVKIINKFNKKKN